MGRGCRIFLAIFAVAYALALVALVAGTFGLFGNERDPLSGVFLLPLGLPWTLMTGGTPEALRPYLAAGAPLVNLVILWFACRALAARRR